jgi:hypothetical protein
MRTCYIAGKVTGLEYRSVCYKFNKAEAMLKSKGYKVVNPVKIIPQDTQWEKAMEMCLAALSMCDCIYLLPDWKQSRGARQEFREAMNMGMPIVSRMVMNTAKEPETVEEKELTETPEEIVNKKEKNEFLNAGGILLRAGLDRNDQPIIKQKTAFKDWHTKLTFTQHILRDKAMSQLAQRDKLFKIDE